MPECWLSGRQARLGALQALLGPAVLFSLWQQHGLQFWLAVFACSGGGCALTCTACQRACLTDAARLVLLGCQTALHDQAGINYGRFRDRFWVLLQAVARPCNEHHITCLHAPSSHRGQLEAQVMGWSTQQTAEGEPQCLVSIIQTITSDTSQHRKGPAGLPVSYACSQLRPLTVTLVVCAGTFH